MAKFRKKPVVVEAVQWFGSATVGVCGCLAEQHWHVHTIHDSQTVEIASGDWIILEPDGVHFYPCKPDFFEATYEAVDA